ncbi:MAG: hypothetical protein V4560_17025 [Bacteroidota bacterium]
MKLRIYNIALMAFIAVAVSITTNAQNVAPVPAVPATPAVPPVASAIDPISAGPQVGVTSSQDTTYRTKMRKLQEQMRALSKEMSELSKDQYKKSGEAMNQRMIIIRKNMNVRFDSTFNKNMNRTFANNMRFNFNTDANLDKQVQSGEVKEKSKTFSKSYPVDASDKLQIDNRYGKIIVNAWNKNEVKVDVEIKAYANEDADAQKLIDQTTIISNKEKDLVSFKTDIEKSENSWWGTSSENGKITKVRKVVINYTVYMPAKSALTINNRYGIVSLPSLGGKLNINNTYGGLIAKDLTNTGNVIVVRYGDANIGSLTGSDISVAYGSLALESADNLNATISYSPAKIGKLNSSGTINLRYGDGLVINDLGKQLKTLTVNSSYAPVKLGSMADTNADFDVTVHNSDFMYNNAVNVTSTTPDKERGYTSTKTYKGHVGKGNADKLIVIKANYGGGVKFEQ